MIDYTTALIYLIVAAITGLAIGQISSHPGWLKPGFISRLSMREKILLLVLSLLAVSSMLPGEW